MKTKKSSKLEKLDKEEKYQFDEIKKLGKEEKIGSDSVYEFESSIDNIISHLKEKKEYYEGLGYTNIRIEFKDVWGYYDDHYIEAMYYGRKKIK